MKREFLWGLLRHWWNKNCNEFVAPWVIRPLRLLGASEGAGEITSIVKRAFGSRGAHLEVRTEENETVFLRHHPKMREGNLGDEIGAAEILREIHSHPVGVPATHTVAALAVYLAAQGGAWSSTGQ